MERKTVKTHRTCLLFFVCVLALGFVYLPRYINRHYNAVSETVLVSVENVSGILRDEIPTVSSRVSDKSHESMFRETFDASKVSEFPIGPDNLTDRERYFIYRCDESTMGFCGGLADRIKGIITGYIIANLTGRTFKAEMLLASCDFHRFLVPNQINWYLPESLHKTVVSGSNVATLNAIDNDGFVNGVNDDFLEVPWRKAKFVYFKGNRDRAQRFQSSPRYRKQLSWMANLTYDQINGALYRRLFKPSQYLQNKLNSFLETHLEPKNKLVCAHIRLGQNPSMPKDTGHRVKDEDLPNVWRFLQRFAEENDSRIFFMADSDQLISRVKKMPFGDKVFSSPGPIVHIDRSPNIAANVKCEGLEKVILEQLVLMHCDVLMIAKSGISRFAAYVRGTDIGLYCFLTSGTVEPCKRSEILQKYNIKLGPNNPRR